MYACGVIRERKTWRIIDTVIIVSICRALSNSASLRGRNVS